MASIRLLLQAVTTTGTPPVDQDFDVSGLTETPKGAVYEATSSGSALANHYRYTGGITDGAVHRAMGMLAENGVLLNADAEGRFDIDTVVQSTLTTSQALNGEARMTGFHSGGSRLAWDDLCATALRLKTLYFLGDDVQCAVVEFTGNSTQDATSAVTGLAFAPNFAFALSHYGVYSADGTTSPMRIAIGYAVRTPTGGIQQIAFTDRQSDRPTTTEGGTVIRDDCLVAKVNNGSDGARLEVTKWTDDGLEITTRGTSEAVTTALLLVRFANRRLWCGIPSLTTTSTGVKPISGLGIGKPIGYFAIATELQSKNSSSFGSDTSKWSHGVVDSNGVEGCVGMQAQDNQATSNTSSITPARVIHVLDDSGGDSWRATHSSFDTDGFSISVDDASSAGNRMCGFCVIGTTVEDDWLARVVRRRHRTLLWGPTRGR